MVRVTERARRTASGIRHNVESMARRARPRRPRGRASKPEASSEQEWKFEVGPSFELPDFGDGAGLTVLDDAHLDLVAVYYDTPDLRLTRSGASLRHRNDEGWMVKLPADGDGNGAALTRTEYRFPGKRRRVPEGAADLIRAWVREAPLEPVAKIETHRHRVELGDPKTGPVAEVDDDRVVATVPDAEPTAFHEVEVELLGDAKRAVEASIVSPLQSAGARDQSDVPKIKRALGRRARRPADFPPPTSKPYSTLRDLLRAALAASVERLLTHDAAVRVGEDPEGVHQARVATRRLRSDLRSFRPVLERSTTDPLRDELQWLGTKLGDVRDADVLEALLRDQLLRLDHFDVDAANVLHARLIDQRVQARHALDAAMRSRRYTRLLEQLVRIAHDPPLRAEHALKKPKGRVRRIARRPWRRVRRAVDALGPEPSDADLHEVRKRAKAARYTAEAVAGTVGRPAKRFAKGMERVQDELGDHQDRVVARAWLAEATRATNEKDVAFLAGELAGLCADDAGGIVRRWPSVWRKASRKKRRAWL
jgi:CHAD domain-containing protein